MANAHLKGIEFAVMTEAFDKVPPAPEDLHLREFWEILCVMTLVFHLRNKHAASPDVAERRVDDVCEEWGIRRESIEDLASTEVPTDSWWACLVSRAREAEIEATAQHEMGDWVDIGNVCLGFSELREKIAVHREALAGGHSFEPPPLIPDLIAIYETQAELQRMGVGTPAVSEQSLARFQEVMACFWMAVNRRHKAFESIPADTAGNHPYLQIFGDVAALQKWEKEQLAEYRKLLQGLEEG